MQLQLSLGKRQRKRPRRAAQQATARSSAFAEAMAAARDILQWRLGPNPPEWRVYRLAQALEAGK